MKNYSFFLVIVVIFNYCILNTLAKNNFFIITIQRDVKDKKYYDYNFFDQSKFTEFVNDRMNDIYDIIAENKDTYNTNNETVDVNLGEIDNTYHLRKRNDGTQDEIVKFDFFSNRKNSLSKRSFDHRHNSYPIPFSNSTTIKNKTQHGKNRIKYIPIDSTLVKPICPILNTYAINVYLSSSMVSEIKNRIPNIVEIEERITGHSHSLPYEKYYNENEILQETHWKELNVQENYFDYELRFSHLSLISQGKFYDSINSFYDNNYYYPGSAGKGVDIFIVDVDLRVSEFKDEFDIYNGERTISCDAICYDSTCTNTYENEIYNCTAKHTDRKIHGTYVAIAAAGRINGVAKKANIHMIAADLHPGDDLAALDFIRNSKRDKHKTIINISRGYDRYIPSLERKISELADEGIIIIVSSGNRGIYSCDNTFSYSGSKGAITVGYTDNNIITPNNKIEDLYKKRSNSNYGPCIDIHAPGTVRITKEFKEGGVISETGSSMASPLVAGVAAIIMSENPEKEYTFEMMKQTIIDLSLKNVITDLNEATPNRFLNNGKHSLYHGPRCDDPSGYYACEDGCCSKFGHCVALDNPFHHTKDLCNISSGCQRAFGYCEPLKCNTMEGKDVCREDECCAADGVCVPIFNDPGQRCYIENGCIYQYGGTCLTNNINVIEDEYYRYGVYDKYCKIELEPFKNCLFKYYNENHRYNYFYEDDLWEVCQSYRDNHCKEFLESPFQFAPSCEKSILYYEYDEIPVRTPMINLEIAERNLMCSMKNEPFNNDYCDISYNFFVRGYENSYWYTEYKEECRYYECRESLSKYFIALNSLEPRQDYVDTIYSLNSDECIMADIRRTPVTTTTTKKTSTTTTRRTSITTTRKTSTTTSKRTSTTTTKMRTTTTTKKVPTSTVSDRCGPDYGACSKSGYCCSKYNYCGTSDDYCGKGCQSEYGKCY